MLLFQISRKPRKAELQLFCSWETRHEPMLQHFRESEQVCHEKLYEGSIWMIENSTPSISF